MDFIFVFENREKLEAMVAEEAEAGLDLKVELAAAEERGRMKSPRNQFGASSPTLGGTGPKNKYLSRRQLYKLQVKISGQMFIKYCLY